MPKKDPAKKRAEEQRVKNLERALKEERLGLVAIARVFLEESENSGRVLRRLEAMARRDGLPDRTRDVLVHGHNVLSRAAEQLQGRPQTLFDPHVGHVPPKRVEAITETPVETQMGLLATEREPLADVKHAEGLRASEQFRSHIIGCLQSNGALTDDELWAEYTKRHGKIYKGTVVSARRELARLGRVVEQSRNGERRWTLMEAKAL